MLLHFDTFRSIPFLRSPTSLIPNALGVPFLGNPTGSTPGPLKDYDEVNVTQNNQIPYEIP
jgi:hypothetical protein